MLFGRKSYFLLIILLTILGGLFFYQYSQTRVDFHIKNSLTAMIQDKHAEALICLYKAKKWDILGYREKEIKELKDICKKKREKHRASFD